MWGEKKTRVNNRESNELFSFGLFIFTRSPASEFIFRLEIKHRKIWRAQDDVSLVFLIKWESMRIYFVSRSVFSTCDDVMSVDWTSVLNSPFRRTAKLQQSIYRRRRSCLCTDTLYARSDLAVHPFASSCCCSTRESPVKRAKRNER